MSHCDPMDCSPPCCSVHGISQVNTGVGSHSFLQGIFPTQGSNLGLLHYRWILFQSESPGKPNYANLIGMKMLSNVNGKRTREMKEVWEV